MNRRYESCRGSWDTYGYLYTDLAEDPFWWMLRHELDTWIRRHGSCRGSWEKRCWDINPETWILQRIREIQRCWDMNPEISHMVAELWIRQYGSCRGSWDTDGCWDMNPETWILQRSLRHKDVEAWIRRWGSYKGSILVDATAWIGDMTPAEDLEIRNVQKTQTYVLSTFFLWFVAVPRIGRLTSRIFCCCPPTHCLGSLAGIFFLIFSKFRTKSYQLSHIFGGNIYILPIISEINPKMSNKSLIIRFLRQGCYRSDCLICFGRRGNPQNYSYNKYYIYILEISINNF